MALQYPPYQPSFYGVQQTPAFNPVYPQSQTNQSNVIWVQGEAAAIMLLIASRFFILVAVKEAL